MDIGYEKYSIDDSTVLTLDFYERSDPTCPLCQEEEETALHLLGRCNTLSLTRFSFLAADCKNATP